MRLSPGSGLPAVRQRVRRVRPQTIRTLTGNGDVFLGSVTGSGNLTLNGNTANYTYGGIIQGDGGLIKLGTGTLTLTNNTAGTNYFGTTGDIITRKIEFPGYMGCVGKWRYSHLEYL